jgi:hypothetical protein
MITPLGRSAWLIARPLRSSSGLGPARVTAGGCVIVQRATNDPVFGLGFALKEQNFAWTGHLAGRQSLTNKNMDSPVDSPEAQPYLP